ncbi:MAG TPA: DNA polymerase III subunit gamma/tau [Candidatus Dependentiae bacterium]|nr:DNA polymerase III subunit gamma/tau [Candidatus Dependentiae bacterium]HRQ62617.1 DNA polymerase III subunit gamma/tau [Candidatus Dependentiae bacterium]
MNTVKLNLARKWRSKNFNEIVGQELSVRMLKNSLYKGQYFPVYLFSGQRGCGKTTTARVFAMALNCEQLELFQQKPQKAQLPCLTCISCTAMLAGKHPDFIEMDAASHTGVDNVRQIVDAASLMPLMGTKKIYLIDEAHMLSKAAFNALLKVLEEPPSSVLFILATTDPHKIIDTVRSRCFQLFFKSIEVNTLVHHLQNICVQENIQFDEDGLHYIVKETDGSARDALNMLEQVRFSSSIVNKEAVLNVLGYLDDARILGLFDAVVTKTPATLLQTIKEIKLSTYAPEYVWGRLLDLARALLWAKHGVASEQFSDYASELSHIATHVSLAHINHILDTFYENESAFLRTTAKYSLLEMILLQLCHTHSIKKDPEGSSSPVQQASVPMVEDESQDLLDDEEDEGDFDEEDEEEEIEEEEFQKQWQTFIVQIQTINDPLVTSIFTQGSVKNYNPATGALDVEFSKDLSFFSDWLKSTEKLWFPILCTVFNKQVKFNPLFSGAKKEIVIKHVAAPIEQKTPNTATTLHASKAVQVQKTSVSKVYNQTRPQHSVMHQRNNGRSMSMHKQPDSYPIDVSDTSVWQKTNLILQYFPGTVREIRT